MTKAEIKNQIKKHLWLWGHRVKDVEKMPGIGYDLLVNDKIRTCIGAPEEGKGCDLFAWMKGGQKFYAFWKGGAFNTPGFILRPERRKTKRSREKLNINKKVKNLTPAKIAKIKKLHKQGLSEREIAKRVKCARSTVWYWLQK